MSKAMSRPITIMAKIGEGRYQAFQAIGWKIRSEHIVEVDSNGETVCDCQMFRFEGKCSHSVAADLNARHVAHANGDWRKADKPVKWQEAKDRQYLVVLDDTHKNGDEPEPAVLAHSVGDLSLGDALVLLTADETSKYIKDAAADDNSILNPERLLVEAKAALDNGVAVTHQDVITIGRAVPKLQPKDVEKEEFDESLKADTSETVQQRANVSDWRKVKRPDPKSFYVKSEDWETIIYTLLEGGNVLLVGPTGCGKTELAYIAGKACGLPIAAFNFGAMTEPRTALIGQTHFDKEKGTWFNESRFVKAVKAERGAIIMDELTRDRGAAAHNIILTLLDRQGYLALDEAEDAPVVKKGEKICFVATANVGAEYTGTEALDIALKNRMDIVIELDFPPKEFEVKILMGRCPGLRASDASRLVDIATRQRELARNDGEFLECISTRMLLAAGKRIGDGMEFETAVQYALINHFSSEGGDASERTKVAQIVQKGK